MPPFVEWSEVSPPVMWDVCRFEDCKFKMDRKIESLDGSSDVPVRGSQLLLGCSNWLGPLSKWLKEKAMLSQETYQFQPLFLLGIYGSQPCFVDSTVFHFPHDYPNSITAHLKELPGSAVQNFDRLHDPVPFDWRVQKTTVGHLARRKRASKQLWSL